MEVVMFKDKVTKNAVRYSDGGQEHAKNIYLTKDEVKAAGLGDTIMVNITPMPDTKEK